MWRSWAELDRRWCPRCRLVPSDEDLWIRFLRHGVIAPHLPESQYPTLYGVFLEGEVVSLKELWERPKDFELPYCLLLDRAEEGALPGSDRSHYTFVRVDGAGG